MKYLSTLLTLYIQILSYSFETNCYKIILFQNFITNVFLNKIIHPILFNLDTTDIQELGVTSVLSKVVLFSN